MTEPYLFRQNFLKWWNKFDFFDKEAVYSKRGVIALTPPTAPTKQTQPTPRLSQEEAMKLFAETFGVQIEKDKGKRPMSPYQDSQDPYEDESDDSLMELTQHLGKKNINSFKGRIRIQEALVHAKQLQVSAIRHLLEAYPNQNYIIRRFLKRKEELREFKADLKHYQELLTVLTSA
ncbi:hypothetical protein CDL12_01652 [Handroanthus impetiginosus]|uniref:Uncharacterized protein n=1 Tax=Handroanthus impetiginosus TaxID=429701 RepID=A0A2G9I780_9LAMI|nr:hypothetical protein CDL12_01652 [Handroanthus impetiginosus]